MTSFLVTLAEVSNAVSGAVTLLCLMLVMIFIIRYQNLGEGGGVVYVPQKPQQVSLQQVYVPYVLKISNEFHQNEEGDFMEVELKCSVNTKEGCHALWWWGYDINEYHELIHQPWRQFIFELAVDERTNMTNERTDGTKECSSGTNSGCLFLGSGEHKLHLRSPKGLTYGPAPRKLYPLVVIVVDTKKEGESHSVGALISAIHIKDKVMPDATRLLHQYLKQLSGQLTLITTLYTQTGGVTSHSNDPSSGSGENRGEEQEREKKEESHAVKKTVSSTGIDSNAVSDSTGLSDSSSGVSGGNKTGSDSTNVSDSNSGTSGIDSTDVSDSSSGSCVICQSCDINVALLPCRHVVTCEDCFTSLMERRQNCPMCRATVTAYFKV